MAAQLIGTNGAARRGDQAWISRAMTSLPVPVSPVSSTDIDVGATRATCATTRRGAGAGGDERVGGRRDRRLRRQQLAQARGDRRRRVRLRSDRTS